jgi:hypothetical protein
LLPVRRDDGHVALAHAGRDERARERGDQERLSVVLDEVADARLRAGDTVRVDKYCLRTACQG